MEPQKGSHSSMVCEEFLLSEKADIEISSGK